MLFFIIPNILSAQNNGLHFYGQERVQDKRTSLDLTPDRELCFEGDFELSFDLFFTPKYRDYYGYIFRIVDNNDQHIDLIYDQKSSNDLNFKIISGDKFSNIAFHVDKKDLFGKWNHFKISYKRETDELIFHTESQVLREKNAGLKKSECFKFLFGANDYKRFKTTDVPTMNIKDIRLYRSGKVEHYWPLDELNGLEAFDQIKGSRAVTKNPLWINEMHTNWKMVKSFAIKGHPSTAFNPISEEIYFVGPEALYSLAIGGNRVDTIRFRARRDFTAGNQSIFDPGSNRIYNFFIDQKKAAYFDLDTKRWNQEFERPKRLTKYWHANKFISKADSSLYIFGGYGQLKYKDSVQRYQLNSKKWGGVNVKGDTLRPRYLAALGATSSGKSAYIIGGFGSSTGQQMLNPENYYDLLRFDLNSKNFKKVYSLPQPATDFAFAGSLVLDATEQEYYGLIFPNNKFDSHLQLIRGSLTSPKYQLIGNYIPYLFHDIHSYADLYYSRMNKKLVSVTLFTRDDDYTEVKVYTIESPPNVKLPVGNGQNRSSSFYLLSFFFLMTLTCGYFYYRRNRSAKEIKSQFNRPTEIISTAHTPVSSEKTVVESISKNNAVSVKIYLFGNMQWLDDQGNEISRQLSPLLKELLLLIFLNSMRGEEGISSKRLDELLWFGKSEKVARNNRSVNIAKLKSALDKLDYCKLNKDSGFWRLDFNFNEVYVDYQHYLRIVLDKDKPDKENIKALFGIVQRGAFLSNLEYDWLDEFKSEISHEVINVLLNAAKSWDLDSDPEFNIQLANHVFSFDSVNEDAMVLKCKALANLGKHALAKQSYEKFLKDYAAIYNEPFGKSFQSIIGS